MSRQRLAIAALCALLVLPAESALAYQDRGFDPDDRRVVGYDPDIRSTVRTVWTTDGGRALSVKFRAYEELGVYWDVTAYLDSRGGHRADYLIDMVNADQSGAGCRVYRRKHSERAVDGRFRQHGDRARCRVPARLVHPTKRIRWRLRSESGYVDTVEAAPDHGWYP
jgi:hypothetical protein